MNDDFNNDMPRQTDAVDCEQKNRQTNPLAGDPCKSIVNENNCEQQADKPETRAAGEDDASVASGNADPAKSAAAGGSCEAAKGEEPSAFTAGGAQTGYGFNVDPPQSGQYNYHPQKLNYQGFSNNQPCYGQYQGYAAGAANGGYPQAPQNMNQTENPYAAAQPGVSPYIPGNGAPYYSLPPKKKTPVGLIIFLVTAAVIFLICGMFAIYTVSQNTKDVFGGNSVFDRHQTEQGDDSSDIFDDGDLIDTTNDNAEGLKLEKQPKDIFTSEKYTAKNAYDKAKESVVGIVAYSDKEKTQIASQGTGIVISGDGYIVTNSHVIGDSKKKYKVAVIVGGDEINAQVTGYDTRTDIAVLKIEKTGLAPARFADSDEIQVGQEVVAIGNPGGIEFSNSITQGIVSALDRDVSHGNVSYIQTDAAINPGNSGGPLLNMSGQVIGITTVKIVNTSYEGMGFAIPSQQAANVINNIIRKGYVEGRVRLGITGNEINPAYSSYYDMPAGVYVVSVDENGPLADKDIQEGDIITKLNDVEITSFSVLYKELDKYTAGDTVTLTYERQSGIRDEYKEETLTVTLQADTME